MKAKDLEPWLVLSFMPGMTSRVFNKLLEQFKTPLAVLNCEQHDLIHVGVKAGICAEIKAFQSSSGPSEKVRRSLSWLQQEQHFLLTLHCQNYPYLLKQIPDPPPILYVKGNPELLALPQIAMVGSRNPSRVGGKDARRFAKELSKAGFSICSGMAQGIDYESHMGALENAGATIAVMATGIDKVYPFRHENLASKIIERGALVTELPLGCLPSPWNFPKRNRIISGLSMGVFVVEAAIRSGSLISARFALEQGKEVFAMPGSIHNSVSKGCHHLIKQGAVLVEKVEDIVEELEALIELQQEQLSRLNNSPETTTRKKSSASEILSLSVDAGMLLAIIDHDLMSVESLLVKTGFEASKMSALITELELKGFIEPVTGGYTLSTSL